MQFRMDLEAMESELIPESTQASDDGALLHLGEQSKQRLLSRKQCLEQRRLSASRFLQQSPTTEHATTSDDTLRRDDGRGTAGTS